MPAQKKFISIIIIIMLCVFLFSAALSAEPTSKSIVVGHTDGFVRLSNVKTALSENGITKDQPFTVAFDEGVMEISHGAFSKCTGLTSVTVPGSVVDIGRGTFLHCEGLKNVIIQDGVTTIKGRWPLFLSYPTSEVSTSQMMGAFAYCKNLSSIVIPESVTTIEEASLWAWDRSECPVLIIYCKEGSYAQTYAIENGIPYSFVSPPDYTPNPSARIFTPTPTSTFTPAPTPIQASTPPLTPTPTSTLIPSPTPRLTPIPTTISTPTPTFSSQAALADDFADMPRGAKPGSPEHHWAIESIYIMADKGIINGYDDGTCKPEQWITRAEYVQMLTKVFQIYDPDAVCPEFEDVKEGDWYRAAIASAKNHDITSGKSGYTFEPMTFISREEMMTITARLLKKLRRYEYPAGTEVETLLEKFTDKEDISQIADFIDAIALNIKLGIVEGSEQKDGSWMLFPKAEIKRGEAAKILVAAMDK